MRDKLMPQSDIQSNNQFAAVIPAYNEATTIRDLASRVRGFCTQVIVVDDGSSDDTAAQLDGLDVTLLRHPQNQGKAASLWDGMQRALTLDVDGVITLDGDGQHAADDIPRLIASAVQHPNTLIIAARQKNLEEAPRARLFANRFADFWVSWAAGQKIHDSQSGFRLYPSKLLRKVDVPHQQGRGFIFESEIIIEAVRAGFNCLAIPIAASYPANARSSHFRPVADITGIVLMISWKLLRWGLYPLGLYRTLTGKQRQS